MSTNNMYPIPVAYPTPIADPTLAYAKSSAPPVSSPRAALPSKRSTTVNENQVKELMQQGFTRGLAASVAANKDAFPLRIWVVDNSGSMQKTDGHRFVDNKRSDTVRMVPCSRWDEIRDCVDYHLQLSALLEAPTQFRMLNNPRIGPDCQLFSVAEMGTETIDQELSRGMDIMGRARPGGTTPLSRHVNEIREYIEMLEPQLNAEGQRVVVVLATDGLPSDEQGDSNQYRRTEFVNSLRRLEGMPVWMVIRLCTDEEDVVEFYNDLDDQLEISLEVLDDFVGEAQEVVGFNGWLNYALPLHRLREMGYYDRVFDMLDERMLTKSELKDFCRLLFGRDAFDGAADPEANWKDFVNFIGILLKKEAMQWDPIKKRMAPWIDLRKLCSMYGDDQSCGCTIL